VDPEIEALIEVARAARDRAHAPYSSFPMGAAVRTSSGEVVPGALVENVSLGLAMCAERVAMFASVATGAGQVEAVALVAGRTDDQLTLPCGACLQVARELGGPDTVVVASDPDGDVGQFRLGDLAPRLPAKR
jgi:cytidine deaminase